ncbi:MAG: hypothetical protein ABF665_06805, partial [Gluconacetobacter sp.]
TSAPAVKSDLHPTLSTVNTEDQKKTKKLFHQIIFPGKPPILICCDHSWRDPPHPEEGFTTIVASRNFSHRLPRRWTALMRPPEHPTPRDLATHIPKSGDSAGQIGRRLHAVAPTSLTIWEIFSHDRP